MYLPLPMRSHSAEVPYVPLTGSPIAWQVIFTLLPFFSEPRALCVRAGPLRIHNRGPCVLTFPGLVAAEAAGVVPASIPTAMPNAMHAAPALRAVLVIPIPPVESYAV